MEMEGTECDAAATTGVPVGRELGSALTVARFLRLRPSAC
jgi:hypothetical protein